jgi:peptide/nickel transport system substrate-binding protein
MNVQHPRRLAAASAVAVITALALAACSAPDGGSATAPPAADAVAGGTLTVGTPPDGGCIDPQQVQQRAVLSITRQMTDSLIYQNPDTEEFEPWLAESWEISEDGTTYTFSLRDDVTFSDGTDLTADTVVANLDAIVAMGARAIIAGPYLRGFTGAEAIDDATVQISFEAPNAQFLQAASTPSLGIVAEATAALTPDERCQGEIVGSGPFVLEDFRTAQSATLAQRDDAYGWAPAALDGGGPYLDTIEFQMIPDTSVRAGSLVSAQLDVANELQPQDVQQVEAAGLPIVSRPNPGFPNTLFVNPDRAPLDDPAIRQAMQIGFDREEVVTTTLTAQDLPATDALSSTTPGYTDHADLLAYDVDAANELLDDAGWVAGGDGIRERDGQRAEVQVMYYTPIYLAYVPLLELMRQQYAEVGIDFILEPVPTATGQERQLAWDFDVRMSGQTRADPAVLRSQTSDADAEVNELLAAQAGEVDIDARLALVQEATARMLETALVIPIHELALPMSHTQSVQGIALDATNGLLLVDTWKQN